MRPAALSTFLGLAALGGCPLAHVAEDRDALDAGYDAPVTLDAERPLDAPPARDVGPDVPLPDVGTDARPSRVCLPSCTTDAQCATSCPANPLGANCCDRVSARCYAAVVPVCPAPGPADAGVCVPSCETHADCESSCPSYPGYASNCCDPTTRTCYVVAYAICPAPDGG